MTPPHDVCTGYDSFWAAADPAPVELASAGPPDAYAAFLAAAEGT